MKEVKITTPTWLDELKFDISSKYGELKSAFCDAKRKVGETEKTLKILGDISPKYRRELDDLVYCVDLNHNKNRKALLVGGFFGDDHLSTRYLLSLMQKLAYNKDVNFDVSIVPLVGVKEAFEYEEKGEMKFEINPDTKRLILDEIEKGWDMYVQYSPARPYMDGFYIETPEVSEESLRSANDVVEHLLAMNFEVGLYSFRDDRPTHPVVRDYQKNSILNQASEHCKSLEFFVNNLESTIEASLYLLKK